MSNLKNLSQDPIIGSRRYKDMGSFGKKSDTGSGSMASKASEGQSAKLPSGSNRNSASNTANNSQTPKKSPSKASAVADKGLDMTAKASGGSGTIGGEATKLAKTLKNAKHTADTKGKMAAGADVAAAGLRTGLTAAASSTGVGAPIAAGVLKAWDGTKKIASVVGIKVEDRYIIYLLCLPVFILLLQAVIFALIVFYAWKHPAQLLRLGFTNFRTFVGAVQALVIENGGASQMAYEVEAGKNSAISAPGDITKPQEGTYEYKLAQIDWEKAKYQTLPQDSRCKIKTKKVVSLIDGKERSVVESVQLNSNPGTELEGIARSNCINHTYPIWHTMMRSQFVREGINKSLNVRYAYAEPQESQTLDQPSDEFNTTLRDKTLTRIWSRGQSYNKPTQSSEAEVLANDNEVKRKFDNTREVQKYSSKGSLSREYSDEVIKCADMYVPKGQNYYEKDIDKMNHDLACGINPKSLLLYTTSPDESLIKDPNPEIAIKPKRAALNVVCDMYYNLLAPGDPSSPAVEKYRAKVKDRINSAAVAGWQAMTYADTHQKRFIDIKELGGDFYKIAGMQKGQEYSYTLDYRKAGTPLEVDAISRIAGFYNKEADNIPVIQQTSKEEKAFQNALNLVFMVATKDMPVIGSPCEAARDDGFWNSSAGNTPSAKQEQNRIVSEFYENVYPAFKKAIAGLDFYARPEKSKSISQIYKGLTYEDLRFRTVRIESNAATAGTEDGPQNFNRMNFGMKAYVNAFTLSMGGKFLTQNEAIARDESTRVARYYEDKSRGLAWRLFNLDNPGSFASRLAVASTDKPQNIPGNVASTLAYIASPIRNIAGESGTLTAFLTGESRVASASSVYDSQNLKLDPAGMPTIYNKINPIENARFIEALKNDPNASAKFAEWDQCFKEFIPSRFHLLNPPPDKATLYKNVCAPLFDSSGTRDINDLGLRYSAYHFHNLQADALVYLSNPNKEDDSLNSSAPAPDTTIGGGGNINTTTGVVSPPNLGPPESNGSYKLPRSTDGSYVYDGDNGTGFGQEWDMCGSKELIDVIYTVAQKWRQKYPNGYLQIGELTSAGHQSHKTGIDADLDGRVGSEWVADFEKGNYSSEKTLELAKMFIDTGLVTKIFYNDPAVISASNDYAKSKQIDFNMRSLVNHDHHFHVRVNEQYKLPEFQYCPSVGHGD